MRLLFSLLALAASAFAQEPSIDAVMTAVARYAAKFDAAAGWAAKETMIQRGSRAPEGHGLRLGADLKAGKPELVDQEIVSLYGFTSDPAIHEVRAITAVDGKPHKTDRLLFDSAIAQGNRAARRKLMEAFNRASIDVAPVDFGPLILLFTRGQQSNYDFSFRGKSLIGADKVLLIRYTQKSGAAALHLNDGGRAKTAALSGQIAVRDYDFAPLRVTLTSARNDTRDEAEVDYVPQADGLLLPASIDFRRYTKSELMAEDSSRLTDWHRLSAAGAAR